MGSKKKTQVDENVVITKHEELSSRASLEKMRKSELVDLVVSTEMRVNDKIDLVALRDAKIEGLESLVTKLKKERDNAVVAVNDTLETLKRVRADLSASQKSCDANKLLVDDLSSQCELLKNLSKREIDTLHNRVSELEDELEKYHNRTFVQRLFGKKG